MTSVKERLKKSIVIILTFTLLFTMLPNMANASSSNNFTSFIKSIILKIPFLGSSSNTGHTWELDETIPVYHEHDDSCYGKQHLWHGTDRESNMGDATLTYHIDYECLYCGATGITFWAYEPYDDNPSTEGKEIKCYDDTRADDSTCTTRLFCSKTETTIDSRIYNWVCSECGETITTTTNEIPDAGTGCEGSSEDNDDTGDDNTGDDNTEDDTSGDETIDRGDYINYEDEDGHIIKCMVLYPQESDGIAKDGAQIISIDTVKNVTLTGNEENNYIEILNTEAEKYLNTKYAKSARSVGSIPDNKNFVDNTSTNYLYDYYQMRYLNITDSSDNYWLASQYHATNIDEGYYVVGRNTELGEFTNYAIRKKNDSGEWENRTEERGLRPVFTLKSGIEIARGSGTETNPYTLKATSSDGNTGDGNTGDDNTGDDNTGNDNTGSDNTGDDNTGDDNTGNDNTGSDNTGSDNTGDDNTGNDNTGDDNTGNKKEDNSKSGGSSSSGGSSYTKTNSASGKTDPTTSKTTLETATSSLPYTGIKVGIATGIMALVAGAIYLYRKLQNYKDI